MNFKMMKQSYNIIILGLMRKKSLQIQNGQKSLHQIIKIQKAWRRFQLNKCIKTLIKRRNRKNFIIKQLLTSEKKYCDHLQRMVNQVVEPSKEAIGDEQSHSLLFSEISDIQKLHALFLQKLDYQISNFNHYTTKISTVILDDLFTKPIFKDKYSSYCANYKKSNQIAKILFVNISGFKQILKKVGIHNQNQLDSALIAPMQRLCKYELMLNSLHKNMPEGHCDYQGINNSIFLVEKLVKQTNQSVQQFLLAQKYRYYNQYQNDTLKLIPNKDRKLIFVIEDISKIDLVTDQTSQFKQLALFNDSILLLPFNNTKKPLFLKLCFIRDLPNLKYFKNIVQIINSEKYLTIQFKKEKQKQSFMKRLEKTNINDSKYQFLTVKVAGTQSREAVFKTYTVYIVEIVNGENIRKIYPRFKDLLKAQQIIQRKKVKAVLPSLSKQSCFSTLKSKTIQRRKLAIQQFLQKVLNNPQCATIPQVVKILKINLEQSKNKKNNKQIIISLPGGQNVKVDIQIQNTLVSDLKDAIAQKLGLVYSDQFQVFQICNKTRRLVHNEEQVGQIYKNQENTLNSMNPFKDIYTYCYGRHHYLEPDDEFELYKNDFVRTQLELSVIKLEIRNYKLEQELMITFMCLFAMYINLPIHQQKKLTSFLKQIGKKQYKISIQQFKTYYNQVQKKVYQQEDEAVTIPFLIIKIMNNSFLYHCQQFEVVVHPKSYKLIKSKISGLEQKLILGIKRSHILLLTVESKHIMQSFPIQCVKIEQTYPTALVLKLEDIDPLLRINTQNGFQISQLFKIYQRAGTQ